MMDTQDNQTSSLNGSAPEGDDAPTTQSESATVDPDDVAPALAAMMASIRSALALNASPQARMAGVAACRSILTVLEAKPGQPLAGAPAPPPQPPLASLLSQPGLLAKLAAMSREELLGMLNQVTGALSPRTQSPASGAPRFHLIQVPQVRRPDGK